MKPLALDLCCGKGGWTRGLMAAGWDVIGFDIEHWDGYPKEAKFVQMDVRLLAWKFAIAPPKKPYLISNFGNVKLVVASPPCQEFSYRSFPFKRCRELADNVPPDTSIWRACDRIARECGAPLVLENVRGAQKYMGRATAHYGSFYLWGDVPAMLPIGKPIKGFRHPRTHGRQFGEDRTKGRNCFKDHPSEKMSSQSMSRKEWSAQAAMIPIELSTWIGKCFYPSQMVEK